MANIPVTTRFIGIADTVNLVEKKSAQANSETQPYTMQDIIDTVPASSGIVETIVSGTNISVDSTDPANPIVSASGAVWGGVTGTLSNQTDLQSVLDDKVIKNTPVAASTKAKITFDSKGLVTNGTNLVASDIPNIAQTQVTNLVTDLSNKQENLVSTTNIKTINGNSVLGSGDLVISGGGGGASGYHMQLLPGGPYYGGIWQGNTNTAGSNYSNQTFADYIMYFPFIPNQDFTSTEMRFQCSIAGSGDEARICIYSHDGNNAPQNKLFESSAVDMSTTGYKTINATRNWTKGEVYWLGIHTKSGLARILGMGSSTSDSLIVGLLNSARFKMWGQTGQTFANGAPSTASPNTFRYDVYTVEFK